MKTKHLAIKEWADSDKPREKLINQGRKALSNAELLAILLGSGMQNQSAVDLAKNILNAVDDNLADLSQLSVHDLCKNFKGVGPAKAVTIIAALELGYRRAGAKNADKQRITRSKDAFHVFFPILTECRYEEFWVAFLNSKNEVIRKQCISSGGIAETMVDIRKIFHFALEYHATGIILGHNHPSGTVKPSNQDVVLTKQIHEAAKMLSIRLLDHIIIGNDQHYLSFADEGYL